ncbi:MAG: Ig-like domain-containing protein [Bryobacteraceae bacterium]
MAIENAVPDQSQIGTVPAANATYTGPQTFSGWAFDNAAAIARLDVSVDGSRSEPRRFPPESSILYKDASGKQLESMAET